MIFSQEFKTPWSLASRVIFRFLFAYCILYILFTFSGRMMQGPVQWFAQTFLGLDGELSFEFTGSGDTSYHYYLWALNLVLALLTTLLWSLIDRKRAAYNDVFYWFCVTLRTYLFFFMLTYGMVKVFKTQFPDHSLGRLMQPIGEMSPMGLAWTFLGHSVGYNLFMGFAEVLGGILILFRKTILLGALIIIGVMTHVAVLNFTYDIPVKIFSTHLVLLALILFLTDVKRFVNLFFRNRPTRELTYYSPGGSKEYHRIMFFVQIGLAVLMLALFSFQGISRMDYMKDRKLSNTFYGVWEAGFFVKNGDTLPPLTTDTERWRYLLLSSKSSAMVYTMDRTRIQFDFVVDSTKNEMGLHDTDLDSVAPNLIYRLLGKEVMELKGIVRGDTLEMLLNRKPMSDFRLIDRPFRWVNEFPYNR